MKTWLLFSDPEFQLHFHYPAATPQGHLVEKREIQEEGSSRVHMVSSQSQEVYFEVTRYSALSPQEEYRRHKAFLQERFASEAFTITELEPAVLGGLPSQQYSFQWSHGERVVVILHLPSGTYRIIYDPRSPLNRQILSTITVIE